MKQANVRSIGAFVIAAALLVVAATFYFGSQDFFKEERRFVAYFNSSVNGLNIGAPVKFRGIEIGQVESIEGVYDPEKMSLTPRVILVIYPETMKNAELQEGEYNLFQPLVKSGMRGSLKSQSLLTGQLYVSLDFYKDQAVRKLGNDRDPYPEMPTVETGLGEFLASIQKLPIDQIVNQLNSTLSSLDGLLSNDDLEMAFSELPALADSITRSANSFGRFADRDLPQTTAEMRKMLATSGNSVSAISNKLNKDTLVRLDATLAKVDQTLALAQTRLDREDPVSIELVNALREISGAAASINRLTEFLEEHPETLIRGKSGKGAEE